VNKFSMGFSHCKYHVTPAKILVTNNRT